MHFEKTVGEASLGVPRPTDRTISQFKNKAQLNSY